MGLEGIVVGIALRLTGAAAATAGMEDFDLATRRATLSLAAARKEISGVDLALDRHALQTEAIALRQSRAMERTARQAAKTRAMIAGAFAIGGAAAIVAGISKAAELEQAMVSVRIATGATGDEFRRLQGLVLSTSTVTAQNAVTIAGEMAAVAAAGLNQPGRLQTAFPQIARAADVLMLGPKHIDPVQAATQLAQLSHLFGAYGGAPLHNMVDAAVRLMYTQPEQLSKIINQGKLFIPMALSAGVPMGDIFTEAMTMGQTGLLSGRGGAGLARYIQYMVGGATLTSHMSKARAAAFKDLGIFDAGGRNKFIDASGKFELEPSLEYLAAKRKTMRPADFIRDVFSGFLQQGGYYVSAVTRDSVMAQRGLNREAMARIAPPGQAVERAWKQYMDTTIGAWRQFTTNFVDLATAVFLPLLPEVTAGLKFFADAFKRAALFVYAHPGLGLGIAVGAISAVSAAAVFAVANLWALNGAILRLGATAGGTGKVIGAGQVLGGFAGRVLAVSVVGLSAAAVGALIAGIFHERNLVARQSGQAAREQWAMHGANAGLFPPGTAAGDAFTDAWGVRRLGRLSGIPSTGVGGGAAFEADRFRRALQDHVSLPIINRLVGAGSSTVTDSVRQSSDHTVEAIHAQTSAIVEALGRIGVTINVPAATGHAQSIHKLLGSPHTPATAGGFASHPTRSSRTGGNFKP